MWPSKIIPSTYRCRGWWCRAFSHWLNPLGNWSEPLPYPKKRKVQADAQWLPNWVWWNLYRNPLHNFCHYWIGITPRGPRYQWFRPEANGWVRTEPRNGLSWWHKARRLSLPYYRVDGTWTFYIGWTDRGNFGIALRRNKQ